MLLQRYFDRYRSVRFRKRGVRVKPRELKPIGLLREINSAEQAYVGNPYLTVLCLRLVKAGALNAPSLNDVVPRGMAPGTSEYSGYAGMPCSCKSKPMS